MKLKATFRAILILLIGIPLLHADEDIPAMIEKLESLPLNERSAFFGSLSQETKEAIAEVRRERGRRSREQFDKVERIKNELFLAGTGPLSMEVVMNYRELGLKVIKDISDPKEKAKIQEHVSRTIQEMAQRMGEPPPPLVIPVWEKNREKLEKLWSSFEWDQADLATLSMVEQAFQPILQELRELAEAEPEQDKPWYLRKKWRSALGVEENESDKSQSRE